MPNELKQEETNGGSSFSVELVAMVAVIAISSWHIGNYMSTFDGWIMAAIMGATLGFCNFLCAHNIFKAGSTSRFPSFIGLIFFAITSTWMQYTYFNENPDIGVTLYYNVNLDALALGIWAPAAEILLGWIYAANVKNQMAAHRHPSTVSPFSGLAQALARRIEHDMAVRSHTEQLRPPEPNMNTMAVQPSTNMFKADARTNGAGVQMDNAATTNGMYQNRATVQLSKSEAMEHMLDIFAANPGATYEQVAAAIGRSKSTVANYIGELKAEGRVQVSDDSGVQVLED